MNNETNDLGAFVSSLFSHLPKGIFKVFLFTFLGFFIGGFLGWLVFFVFVKFSLLSSSWWLVYFIPMSILSGIIGGLLFGVRSGLFLIIIDSGAGKFIVKNVVEGIFKTTDLVTDSEKTTGRMFDKITDKIERMKTKAVEINRGKEFFVKRKLKYYSLKLIAEGIEEALKEPELSEDLKNRNKERFKEVVWRGVNYYLETTLDDLLFSPIMVWGIITVVFEALPLVVNLF